MPLFPLSLDLYYNGLYFSTILNLGGDSRHHIWSEKHKTLHMKFNMYFFKKHWMSSNDKREKPV